MFLLFQKSFNNSLVISLLAILSRFSLLSYFTICVFKNLIGLLSRILFIECH